MIVAELSIVVDQEGRKQNLTPEYRRIDGKRLIKIRIRTVVLLKGIMSRTEKGQEKRMGISMESGVQKIQDSTNIVMMRHEVFIITLFATQSSIIDV